MPQNRKKIFSVQNKDKKNVCPEYLENSEVKTFLKKSPT